MKAEPSHNLTQEYWMYFKGNWQSMAEKEPPFGHVDIFKQALRNRHRAGWRFHFTLT